jgi:DNA-binding response OmpR family regulator
MRIFVIDDEVDVAETLGDVVTELGHQPSLVHTAEAALTALERDATDAILLDIRLPGMDGLEFLRRRRLREAGAPVIGISGVATDAEVWECLRLGALDFARKPLTLELLAALVLYVEAHRPGRDIAGRRRGERRRSARAPLAMPVTVVEHAGTTWQSASIDLSVFGMTLRPGPVARPAEHARLSFIPPDSGSSLDLFAVLVREDPRSCVYRFVNLTAGEFRRLQRLVAELAVRPATPSPAKSVGAGQQSGTLRIVRWSGTDAVQERYTLTFDFRGARPQSRPGMTNNDLLGVLTVLRVSPEARVNALLKLATAGSISLHVRATDNELRQVGFERS